MSRVNTEPWFEPSRHSSSITLYPLRENKAPIGYVWPDLPRQPDPPKKKKKRKRSKKK